MTAAKAARRNSKAELNEPDNPDLLALVKKSRYRSAVANSRQQKRRTKTDSK